VVGEISPYVGPSNLKLPGVPKTQLRLANGTVQEAAFVVQASAQEKEQFRLAEQQYEEG
jgi:hypothetical protein